jgi:hypothetical protein
MSEPETYVEFQPDEKESMEAQKVPTPTDGSPALETAVPTGQDQMANRPGGEGGRFECRICKKSFNSKVELEMHVESLHETKKRKTAQKMENRKSSR